MKIIQHYIPCLCFIFSTCTGSSQQTGSLKPPSDKEFTLSPGKEITVDGITSYLLDIEDTRCPSDDTNCPSRGTVTLMLNLKKDGKVLYQYPLTINLGGSQYLTEKYDIHFKSISPERGKRSQEISKSNYKAVLLLKNTTPAFKVTEITNPGGVIFPKDGPGYRPQFKETQGAWSPSAADAKKADAIVRNYLANPQQVVQDILKGYTERIPDETIKNYHLKQVTQVKANYPEYRRQYLGYIEKETGQKLIYINFFAPVGDMFDRSWKKDLIYVDDGGAGFFQALVDLEDGKCLFLSINGNA